MKCISLWQPWASLWLTSAKIHETRHWSTDHRGPLLVHAAKKRIPKDWAMDDLFEICVLHFGDNWRETLPYGKVLGRVDIADCVSTNGLAIGSVVDFVCGDFSFGRYAWKRGPVITRFKEPIDWVGRQNIFHVPDDLVKGLTAEVVYG